MKHLSDVSTQQRLFYEQKVRALQASQEEMELSLVAVARPTPEGPAAFSRKVALKRCNFGK